MYDLVVQNARICDGTGQPSFIGTLGVQGGLITYIGDETGLAAQRSIDADGLALAPEYVRDFPCNGRRLIARAEGVEATFVAGAQVYERGMHTGAVPGRVLRSYESLTIHRRKRLHMEGRYGQTGCGT